MNAHNEQQPAAAQEAVRKPDGYHYRYPTLYGTGTCIRQNNGEEVNGSKPIEAVPYWYAPVTAAPAEMSPEFTNTARAAIAWVLWHHQGASSPVGQPLRFALGMGADEPLPDWRIAEAKRYAEWEGATTAKFHEARASTPAAPGIDLLGELVAAIKSYRLSASTTNRASIERLDDVLSRIDASPKGEDSIARAFDRAVLEPMRREAKADSPKGGSEAPQNGEVLVTVSGLTGSGKSAVAGEIEILCKALGLEVEWTNGDEEKYLTHADWTEALELYKPRVRIVEINIPRVQAGDAEVQP